MKRDVALSDVGNVKKTIPFTKPVGFQLILMGGGVTINIIVDVVP